MAMNGWQGVENIAHAGFRAPDRPERGESVYRPSYPGRHKQNITIKNCDCDKIHLM